MLNLLKKNSFLEEGDTLFFYTDGLIENENIQGEMLRERNLIRFLKKNNSLSANEIVDSLMEKMKKLWQDNPLEDDITIVACKINKPFYHI